MRYIHESKHYIAIIRPDLGLVGREVTISVCGNDIDRSWLDAILSRVFYIDSDTPMRVDCTEEDGNTTFEVNGAKYCFPSDMVVGLDSFNRGDCFNCGLSNYLEQEVEASGAKSFAVCTVHNRPGRDVFNFASKFSQNIRMDSFLFLAENSFGLHTTLVMMGHINPEAPTAETGIHADGPITITGAPEPKFKKLCDIEKYMEVRRGKHGSVVSVNGSLMYFDFD